MLGAAASAPGAHLDVTDPRSHPPSRTVVGFQVSAVQGQDA